MDSKAMPLIRLTVESMKTQIMHHLGTIDSELGDAMSAEIDKAIATYPWEEEVRKITHDCIDNVIKAYFSYGQGRISIRESVEEALFKVFT